MIEEQKPEEKVDITLEVQELHVSLEEVFARWLKNIQEPEDKKDGEIPT